MQQNYLRLITVLTLLWLLLGAALPAAAQGTDSLLKCSEFGFSSEEDFISGVKQPDGNARVSDGDLLSRDGLVCLRNRELLAKWDISVDLGLDALDIIDAQDGLVVFSTEIDDPKGRFGAGDLLATNGAVIPNKALLQRFQVAHNLGLDGLQLEGAIPNIKAFLKLAAAKGSDFWLDGGILSEELIRYKVDILFTTEAQERKAAVVPIYDGDLLSAANGSIIFSQAQLHAAGVPAGVPNKGVDFGLDGIALPRLKLDRSRTYFSTEILFRKDPKFSDGDVLQLGTGVVYNNKELITQFEPKARFLGLDALSIAFPDDNPAATGGGATDNMVFLPVITR